MITEVASIHRQHLNVDVIAFSKLVFHAEPVCLALQHLVGPGMAHTDLSRAPILTGRVQHAHAKLDLECIRISSIAVVELQRERAQCLWALRRGRAYIAIAGKSHMGALPPVAVDPARGVHVMGSVLGEVHESFLRQAARKNPDLALKAHGMSWLFFGCLGGHGCLKPSAQSL